MGRGSYSVRGRGGGIERGRGRGRGGYYARPHEDEERSFSRPRTFERSQVRSVDCFKKQILCLHITH